MHTFFRGSRRKAGVVALVVALALIGTWIRSRMIADLAVVTVLHRTGIIVSSQSQLIVWGKLAVPAAKRFYWKSSPTAIEHQIYVHDDGQEYTLIDFDGRFLFTDDTSPWVIQYSLITLPLTALSAYLILWNPRKRDSPN
jgi:hypothetical protein